MSGITVEAGINAPLGSATWTADRPGCHLTARSTASWLTITSYDSGYDTPCSGSGCTGSLGGASFNVDYNTSPSQRVGQIVFSDSGAVDKLFFTVTQRGATSTPTPSPVPTPSATIQFAQAAYSFAEDAGVARINVSRFGNTSTSVSVDYATSDALSLQRTSYTTATGTLTFVPGEVSKAFDVLLIDNAYVDGARTINLTLSKPVGADIGAQGSAVLIITDNDSAAASTNPIDNTQFFVRQQYLGFLNREPDAGGFDYWTSQIASCPSGDQRCINSRRVGVSAAFFIEQEFQDTGSYVYRFYKASYAQVPTYAQFLPDRSHVVGSSNLEAGKQLFADNWIARQEFLQRYPQTLTAAEFVDALISTVKTATNNVVDLSANRATYLNTLQASGRGAVLRQIVENSAFKAAEFNRAFVLMQYFGYLRRDPDQGGYDFWLDVVNNRVANNYRSMVCAFTSSAEYQDRFSSIKTRNDSICGQIGQ